MALATTCPQCKTSFRVVPDQLKLKRGLVRCGVCHHVFSGVDSLRYIEDRLVQPVAGAAPLIPPSLQRAPEEPASSSPESLVPESLVPDSLVPESLVPESLVPESLVPESLVPESLVPESLVPESLVPESLVPESLVPESLVPESLDPESLEPGPLEPGPWEFGPRVPEPRVPEPRVPEPRVPEPRVPEPRVPEPREFGPRVPEPDVSAPKQSPSLLGAALERDDDESDAVDFFADEHSARGFSSRSAIFASVVSVGLVALLLLQLTIGGRDWIASRIPALRPVLAAALAPLGMQVGPPLEIGALTIESFELQPAADGTLYAVSGLLRNRTGHVVQWPALELSLLDHADTVVVRKVLRPVDYLDDAVAAMREGVGARAEMPLRAAIEVRDAAPTGYRVRLVTP